MLRKRDKINYLEKTFKSMLSSNTFFWHRFCRINQFSKGTIRNRVHF